MSRTDILLDRMLRTMPLPVPENVVRVARARIAAAVIGQDVLHAAAPGGHDTPGHEEQIRRAAIQIALGATLARRDVTPEAASAPSAWREEDNAEWRFIGEADGQGAEGVFLNLWGKALQVGRYDGETDADYRVRIVLEVISPSTTNMGLAQLIDRLLGMDGTRVIEGEGFFGNLRLNDGHRLNEGERLMGFGAFGAESLWNTFVVITPEPITSEEQSDAVRALCDRRRAAGNRMLTIVNETQAP